MNINNDNMLSSDFELPKDYLFCFLSEGSFSKDCAHFFAGEHTDDRELGTVVLPAAMKGGKCKWFQRLRIIHGAWRFHKLFNEVKAKDAPYFRKGNVFFYFNAFIKFGICRVVGHYKLFLQYTTKTQQINHCSSSTYSNIIDGSYKENRKAYCSCLVQWQTFAPFAT